MSGAQLAAAAIGAATGTAPGGSGGGIPGFTNSSEARAYGGTVTAGGLTINSGGQGQSLALWAAVAVLGVLAFSKRKRKKG